MMKLIFISWIVLSVHSVWGQNVNSGSENSEKGSSSIITDREVEIEEQAQFPGGCAAMMKFVSENIVYPSIKYDQQLGGKVVLKFVVEEDGSLTNIQVAKGMLGCPECDEEAIRVVKLMPKWIPAKVGEKIIRSKFILPIQICLK